jgi:Flp pilus assembly protein CpaB
VATEVKQRNPRVLVVVGAVLALATFALVFYISRNNSSSGTGSVSGATVSVVVAKNDLTQGTQLNGDVLKVVSLPSDRVPGGSYNSVQAANGKFLAVGVTANTPITQSLLVVSKDQVANAALTEQPLDIAAGNVAVAIPTNQGGISHDTSPDLTTVGNNIHAEDRIDILMTSNGSVHLAFQDLRVLQVGVRSGAATGSPTLLVVEVNRAQAEQLTYLFAKKFKADGTTEDKTAANAMTFVLRSHNDYKKGPLDAGNPSSKPVQDTPVNGAVFDSLFPGR